MDNQQAVLASMLPISLLLTDVDRRVVEVSQTWIHEFGPAPIGPDGLFPRPDAPELVAVTDLIEAAIGRGRTGSQIVSFTGENESVQRLVNLQVGPWRRENNTIGGAMVMAVDIGSQSAAERALEQVNADLEFFTHAVSHDLRGPATRQRALTSALLEDFADDLPERVLDRLDRIDAQSIRIVELVAATRALTSLAGQGVQLVPVDLAELIDRVVAELIETEVELDPEDLTVVVDVPRRVNGYPPFLKLLFTNLVRLALGSSARPLTLEIARVDDGIGSVYLVRHGWDGPPGPDSDPPARRVDDALDPRRVALAIARKVVERHGGSLWVRPEADVHEVRFTLADRSVDPVEGSDEVPLSR